MQAAMALHMPHGYGEDVYDFQNLSGGWGKWISVTKTLFKVATLFTQQVV
jgi:hypothetical protein